MIESYISQANQKLWAGQIEEALSLYRQAVEKNPGFYLYYHNWGDALSRKGDWEEAVVAYQSAIELNPSSALSHYKLGKALAALAKIKESVASYSQAVALNPDFYLFQKTLADALTLEWDTKEAVVDCSESPQLELNQVEPNPSEIESKLYDLARTQLLANEYDLAIENCVEIIGKNARLADIIPVLAQAYTLKGKSEEGEAFLQVTPYLRRLVCRPVVQRFWGNLVEDQPQDLGKSGLSKSQDLNKIVIYTCVWQRPELTQVVLSHYSHLKQELSGKIQLELLAVGSEGKTYQKLCESCGFDYVEHPNLPLSAKWEYGLNCCADYDPDAVIIVGSDDIISQSLIEFYDKKLHEGLVFVGIKDGYFFDALSGEMIWWKGYPRLDTRRFGETIGMARCLARPLLDKLSFSAWKGLKLNKRLDRIVTQRLLDLGLHFLDYDNLIVAQDGSKFWKIGHCGFFMQEVDGFAVDIKTSENITPFSLLRGMKDKSILSQEVSREMLSRYLPESTVKGIQLMAHYSQSSG